MTAPLSTQDVLPTAVRQGTVLRVGDPVTQGALKLSGLDKDIPFKIEWADIGGGPQTSKAFRALNGSMAIASRIRG